MRMLFLTFALLPLASACGGGEGEQNAVELANVAEEGGGNAAAPLAKEPAAQAPASAPSPASFAVGPLQVPYDASLLTPVRTKVQVPPDWKSSIEGMKLIGSDRAALIGKAECMYGQAGEARRCNAEQEAGLAFALLSGTFGELSERLPSDQRQKIVLAGVEGLSWQIGAQGEGAEHILLPAGKGTVLIVRHFRNTGNPDEAALGTVLNDLRLTE